MQTIKKTLTGADLKVLRGKLDEARRILKANGWKHILSVMSDGINDGGEYGSLFSRGSTFDRIEFWLNKDTVDSVVGMSGDFAAKNFRADNPAKPTLITDAHLPEKFRVYGDSELAKEFRAYCKVNRIYYYARPREDFHEWEAWELAEKAGALFLLLEDLS